MGRKKLPIITLYNRKKVIKTNTWRRAGTGLAVIQTVCHVLPGINMRELNRPLGGWFASMLVLESMGKSTYILSICFSAYAIFRSVFCLPSLFAISSSIQSRGLYHRMKSSSFPFGLAALKLSISDNSDALIICVRSSGKINTLFKAIKFAVKNCKRMF